MGLKDALLDLLFPPFCILCGEGGGRDGLCGACRRRYAEETFVRCPRCGGTADRCRCGTEFAEELPTEIGGRKFLVLTYYVPDGRRGEERVTDRMILGLKDRGDFAMFFAGELARETKRLFDRAGEDPRTWIASWCPRSPEKYMEKGFDQDEEVARRYAKLLGCRCERLLVRDRSSAEQKGLTAAEREQNAGESLTVRLPVLADRHPVLANRRPAFAEGKKILLFDDIVTTGSTVRSSVRALLSAGAAAVFPVALARTLAREHAGADPRKRGEDRDDRENHSF